MPFEADGLGLSCFMLTAKVWQGWWDVKVGDGVNVTTTDKGSEKDVPAQLRSINRETIERTSVVNGKKYNKEYHYRARRLR